MRTRDALGRFKKGHRKLGGRKLGTPNGATQVLREANLLAAIGDKDELVAYLTNVAGNNPRIFSKLMAKSLPT
jgi:hypothetical protein